MLQKRRKKGPSSICLLRRQELRLLSTYLLIVFTLSRCGKIWGYEFGIPNLWKESCIEECLKVFFDRREKIFRTVPFLALWGIWIPRTSVIFEDRHLLSFQILAQICAIFQFQHYKPRNNLKTFKQVGQVRIDKTIS
jgi:hypothetical protein